jgi:hypothetical protein
VAESNSGQQYSFSWWTWVVVLIVMWIRQAP